MAHFAKVTEAGIVEQVIVVRNEDILDENGQESETVGQQFIASIGLDGRWLQTSYSNSFRGKFAGIGDVWDEAEQVFKVSVSET